MKRALVNLGIRLRNLIVHEFPVEVGIVIAAVNAATVHSPIGYASAVGAALLRFVVSPAFAQAALREKVVDPKLVDAIAKQVAVWQAAAEAEKNADDKLPTS